MADKNTLPRRRALSQKIASKIGAIVFQDVFQAIGGTEGFAEWARQHRTEFYKLYAQYMKPTSSVGDEGGDGKRLIVELHFSVPPPSTEPLEVNSRPPIMARNPLTFNQETHHSDLPPGVEFVGENHG